MRNLASSPSPLPLARKLRGGGAGAPQFKKAPWDGRLAHPVWGLGRDGVAGRGLTRREQGRDSPCGAESQASLWKNGGKSPPPPEAGASPPATPGVEGHSGGSPESGRAGPDGRPDAGGWVPPSAGPGRCAPSIPLASMGKGQRDTGPQAHHSPPRASTPHGATSRPDDAPTFCFCAGLSHS